MKHLIFIGIFSVAGCAAKPAPDFSGGWRPVNELPPYTTAIPFHKPVIYQVMPMDTTLKGLLERWAKDAGVPLSYNLNSDYTLFRPVSRIQHQDLGLALDELSKAYITQKISISINSGIISVDAR